MRIIRAEYIDVFHPVTLAEDSLEQCQAMLDALEMLNDTGLIFTGSNADPGRVFKKPVVFTII